MVVKLFGPHCASSKRVLLCLVEKEIEFEVVPVDVRKGEHKDPEYLKLQPLELFLWLKMEITLFGHTLDSLISGYNEVLCRKNIGPKGLSCWERHRKRGVLWNNVGITPDPKVIEESESKVGKVLDVYEERLSKSKYLAGDFFSLAEISHILY
ncbi:Thioredoxin-like superfamily [Sesbania bispinosa]|nr:Thioredoxin-like superfamily [Sesbania bispinosa]